MKQSEYSQGDVILVPYPYTNFQKRKLRPALVVSCDSLNYDSSDVVAVAISTKVWRAKLYGVQVLLDNIHFRDTGLKAASTILCDKIFTIEKKIIESKIGTLSLPLFGEVKSHIQTIFTL